MLQRASEYLAINLRALPALVLKFFSTPAIKDGHHQIDSTILREAPLGHSVVLCIAASLVRGEFMKRQRLVPSLLIGAVVAGLRDKPWNLPTDLSAGIAY